jgi:hypothetical protein
MGAHRRAFRRPHEETVPDPLGVRYGAVTDLDVRMLLELTLPALAQVRRLDPIMPEQPADTLRYGVRRPVVIHHEHPLARPAEHERRAQARGPATHDDGVVRRAAPCIEVEDPVGHGKLDATSPVIHPGPGRSGG